MNQFFMNREDILKSPLRIQGEDYNHIRNVLRLKCGEEILLADGEGKEYLCRITDYPAEEESVELKIVDILGSTAELPAKITLFQGYPKGDKMETVVQKAVELGAYEIVPVMMKRSVVKLDAKKASKKVDRLNAIALSAAKQSKRGIVPQVRSVMTFDEAVAYASVMDYVLLPYEQAEGMEYSRQALRESIGKEKIAVFIGPEGGFDPSEVAKIEQIGGRTISLGHRILRTETAGLTILSLLMFLLDE